MANYVANRIICSQDVLNNYLLDHYPFDGDVRYEEPCLGFNRLFSEYSPADLWSQDGITMIDSGYGWSIRKMIDTDDTYEILFMTRWYYPIDAIVRLLDLSPDTVWYACEECWSHVSRFTCQNGSIRESTYEIPDDDFQEWMDINDELWDNLEECDDMIWHYMAEHSTEWSDCSTDDYLARYKKVSPYEHRRKETVPKKEEAEQVSKTINDNIIEIKINGETYHFELTAGEGDSRIRSSEAAVSLPISGPTGGQTEKTVDLNKRYPPEAICRFRRIILFRGIDVYESGAIREIKEDAGKYTARIHTTKEYTVCIRTDDKGISEMSCTCPYAVNGNNCKHMAAVILEIERTRMSAKKKRK